VPIIGILLWANSLYQQTSYEFYQGETQAPLFKPFEMLLNWSELASQLVALGLLVVCAFLMMRLNARFSFIRIRTFLPTVIFLIITSGMPMLHHLLPVHFASLFLILSLSNIFAAFHDQTRVEYGFNAGLCLSLGALFYQSTIGFLPFIWIGLFTVRKNPQWRDFVAPILGALIPLIFTFSWAYLNDSTHELLESINQNFITHQQHIRGNLSLQIYMGYLIFLLIVGSAFMILRNFDEKKVSSRKYFTVLFWMFVNSLLLIIAIPAASIEMFMLMAIPLGYLIANYFVFTRQRFWSGVLFYTLIALVIYMQFV
jgi:hypothetical protein